jgi:transposase InsO family protein
MNPGPLAIAQLVARDEDVRQYVSKCDACQRRSGKRELKAPLGDVAEPSHAFQIVHCDVVGPLPITSKGNRYILTFIDKFTKYPEAIPLADVSAVSCARAYATGFVSRYGVNEILVTDKGSNFMSAFFEVCRILGVKHIHTTSFHPIENLPAERMHKTMNRALGFYVNNVGNDWDDLLPLFLMAQRAAPSSVTGYSPYYLLHGYEIQTPSTQNLRANLSPRAQSLDEAGRLRKLVSPAVGQQNRPRANASLARPE